MTQIEETVTFEGILRREEMPETETAKLHGCRNHRQDRSPCNRILAETKFALGD